MSEWVTSGTVSTYPEPLSTILQGDIVKTKSSANADKPARRFRGQSRSPNIVPFHMLGIVSY